MTLGEKLKVLREKKGLAQREIGAIIEVDGAFISKIENNEKPINRDHLKKLSQFFEVDEDELNVLWLADKIDNFLKEEPLAVKSLELILNRRKTNE